MLFCFNVISANVDAVVVYDAVVVHDNVSVSSVTDVVNIKINCCR